MTMGQVTLNILIPDMLLVTSSRTHTSWPALKMHGTLSPMGNTGGDVYAGGE